MRTSECLISISTVAKSEHVQPTELLKSLLLLQRRCVQKAWEPHTYRLLYCNLPQYIASTVPSLLITPM